MGQLPPTHPAVLRILILPRGEAINDAISTDFFLFWGKISLATELVPFLSTDNFTISLFSSILKVSKTTRWWGGVP